MMTETRYVGAAEVFRCGDLATAVKVAKSEAKAGDVILLICCGPLGAAPVRSSQAVG